MSVANDLFSFDTYQEETFEFATYPNAGNAIHYPTDGLLGEIGELMEKRFNPEATQDDLLAELGDVMWYFAATLRTMRVNFEDFMTALPQKPTHDSRTVSQRLAIRALLLKNYTKKITRDAGGVLSTEARVNLIYKLGLLMNLCLVFVDEAIEGSWSLQEVLQNNLEKLRSRKERGVLQGSGDHR